MANTTLQDVYDSFLSKITDYDYLKLSEEDLNDSNVCLRADGAGAAETRPRKYRQKKELWNRRQKKKNP